MVSFENAIFVSWQQQPGNYLMGHPVYWDTLFDQSTTIQLDMSGVSAWYNYHFELDKFSS